MTEILTESDAESGVFTGSSGRNVVLDKDYVLDDESVDEIFGWIPEGSSSVGVLSIDGSFPSCVETGINTRVFNYEMVTPAVVLPNTYTWKLASVENLRIRFSSYEFPVAFRIASAGLSGASVVLAGEEFLLSPAGTAGSGVRYASTMEGKPLIAFLVREKNEAVEEPGFLDYWMFFDHSIGQIRKIPADGEEWKISYNQGVMSCGSTVGNRFSMLNEDGSVADGLLPMDILELVALTEGVEDISIPPDSAKQLEFTGYEPGEAIEIQSVDHPADYFQVAIPGRAPLWTLSERQITAVEIAPGRYRASQKIVIYSSGNNDQQYLSDQQWHTLKNLGYLAIHNGEFVYKSPADTMKLLKELGITDIHPPEGGLPVLHKYLQENGDLIDTKGVPVPTEKLATLARFKVDEFCPHGYQDHHLFNKFYDEANSGAKGKRWESMLKAVMGGDFEIDEFTVPVNTAWHGRTQGPVTAMWEGVYSDLEAKCEFDSAGNARLKRGVSGAALRKGIWKKMEDGAEMMQVSLGRMRPWPTVLKDPSHPLFKKLRAGGWQQGASLEKWQQMSGRSLSQVATQVELQNARKSLTKSLLGTVARKGKVLAGGLLKRSTPVLTILGLLGTTVNLTGAEWREHLSVKLHEEMADAEIAGIEVTLDQCREVVRLHLTENEIIAAGIPHERFILPSGQEIFSGQTIFYEIRFDPNTSNIHTVVWCQIVEIKSFLDGGYKVALRMEDGSSRTFDQSRFRFIVSDYIPECGGSAADWAKAYKKAEVLEFIQNY